MTNINLEFIMIPKRKSSIFPDNVKDLVATQSSILNGILSRNSNSDFGKKYKFENITSSHNYKNVVPLCHYEDIRNDIDKLVHGKNGILTEERVLTFFRTSGSTSRPKLIPVTASYVREKAKAFSIYWDQVYEDYPELKSGKVIPTFGGGIDNHDKTSGGVSIQSESSFWSTRSLVSRTAGRSPIPKEIDLIKDGNQRLYAAARLSLQDHLDGIMCLNPSTLLVFCRTIEENWQALLQGLTNGTWGVDWKVADKLTAYLRKDTERALELSNAQGDSNLKLAKIWPSLQLIMCWRSKLVQPYWLQLNRYLEGIQTRDYISQASECAMAIPFCDGESGGVLAITSHFFEFIPENEISALNPDTLLAWELEQGQLYELVITTSAGLYRYRIGDCVIVNGFKDNTPIIEFLYRIGKTSSMTGEKLTENQIVEAVREASEVVGWRPVELIAFPRTKGLPHYGILMDIGPDKITHSDSLIIKQWLGAFELKLRLFNSEYTDKRKSSRLGAPRAMIVDSAAFDTCRNRIADQNIAYEQIKLGMLNSNRDLDQNLRIRAEIIL